ncbi:DUF317 domain-containing protein [Kitasatospora sp. A2-31]|uniref:DUF317 domain-containing protein n=1 Tax=Kitasatospora sp. A2-31 TaxID=2916414 RepID=UPI001EE9D124|nr:DUF317 domain-containing protein [Kitasatospora sp. A2-31]MCG6497106.1 DUF317 domain-containing protein [Kitasatospora sp. A2-31]
MTTANPHWAKLARDRPWQQVRITPALYAGPTPDTERAIRPLIEAGAVRLDDGCGNQLIISTDGRVRLGYEPQEYGVVWKIAVHERPFLPPLWTVSLTENTPIEVVEAITTDLANRLRTGGRLTEAAADPEWRTPLHANGWTLTWDAATGTETACSVYSPQDTIVLNTRAFPDPEEWEEAGQDAFWSVDIASDFDGWSAAASTSTPDSILHTMVSAMLAPAVRDIGDLGDLAVGAAVIGAAELTEIPSSPTPLDVHRAQAARTTSPTRAAADSTRTAFSAPATSPQPAAGPGPRSR